MPQYTAVDDDYIAFAGGKSVFVDRGSFAVQDIRKSTSARGSDRQLHFYRQLEQLGALVESRTIPVFIRWRNAQNRMDLGCIGHALASGYIVSLISDQSGTVTHVTLGERA